MKIAIISDIHGNLAALEAVAEDIEQWHPDEVLVNGDTVNRGPDSPTCWHFVQQRGWQHARGNHENYLIERLAHPDPLPDDKIMKHLMLSYWTYHQFEGDIVGLKGLPDGLSLSAPDGSELRTRHASMMSNTDGIYLNHSEDRLRSQIMPLPALFVTSHTHKPYIRHIDDTIVANSGSVGAPCDGDRRASYIRAHWVNGRWQAIVQRVPYDFAQTDAAYHKSGLLTEGGALTWLIYHEWRLATDMLVPWRRAYEKLVRNGEMELETAVCHFLSSQNLECPPKCPPRGTTS